MNKLNTLIVSLFLLVGAGSLVNAQSITPGVPGHYSLEITSAQVFSGSGVLYKVILATGSGTSFTVAVDTVAQVSTALSPTSFHVSTQIVTPFLIHVSTDNAGTGANNVWTAPDGGVRLANGLWVFSTQAATIRATFYYRKGQ